MQEQENEKVIKELKPSFNFLYEIFMPTGRKIKSSLMVFVLFIIITIILSLKKELLNGYSSNLLFGRFTLPEIVFFICYAIIILALIKLIFHIVLQKMQYDHISYRFYESYMIYEDDFLNQHKKNIQYSNIKEVEIRRTILDRMLGMGVIVIYTNAENKRNNGLVVYGLRNPKEDYDFIDKLIHQYKISDTKKVDNNMEDRTIKKEKELKVINEKNEEEQMQRMKNEESFKESLKEIK